MKNNQSKQQNAQDFIFTVDDLPESIQPKLLPLAQLLNLETTPLPQLKSLLSQGIPEQAARIRQFVWKITLNYLPKHRKLWHTQIHTHQQIYQDLVHHYLNPTKYHSPLPPNKTHPQWKQHYEQDYQLWQQIQKDTCRTQAQLAFFSALAPPLPLPFLTNTRKQKLKLILGSDHTAPAQLLQTYRFDYLTRILFIFARLNPKVQYVQGMNELIAPIYYLLHHHQPARPPQEAAAFFMLNNVISDLLEMHMRDFSLQQNPIHARLALISTSLLALQPKTWQRLEALKIDPFYYCFRWLTLLFAQQFEMYETLRLWESIFSHDDRTAYTNFVALALLIGSREVIATQDYGSIMAHLKTIGEHVQLDDVIKRANKLYATYRSVDLEQLAEKNRRKMKDEGGRLARLFRKLF